MSPPTDASFAIISALSAAARHADDRKRYGRRATPEVRVVIAARAGASPPVEFKFQL
jgi:hypothetical protein